MYTANSNIKTAGRGERTAWVTELTNRGADLPEAIVDAYIKYGNLIGYNYDLALAQGIQESGGFTDYKWIQFRNPAGLGSTSRQVPGNIYPSVEAGISAQYAHQCAYAETAESCPIEKMGEEEADFFNDSRHQLVGHQGNPYINVWDGHWAIPGNGYASAIAGIANAVVGVEDAPPPVNWQPPREDLRPILYRNPAGGPNAVDDNKVGIVWHYNGPPPNTDARQQYINDAIYHGQKDWGGGNLGDGIMYHYGIGGDGTIYLLRDEAAILWHCGAWVPGGNGTGIAININIGEGEEASPEQIRSAAWLADELRTRRGIDISMCKGHQELSPTACPGSLMQSLVIPYRDGQLGGTVTITVVDDAIHENGFIIAGGFGSKIRRLEALSHDLRMQLVGYAISNEGDGYLLVPETGENGATTGRYRAEKVVLQKFERTTLIHEANEPNADWQDVVPLLNRGYLVGFADDPAIDAILKNPAAQF